MCQPFANCNMVIPNFEHEGASEYAGLFHQHRLAGMHAELAQSLSDIEPSFDTLYVRAPS